MGRPVRQGWLVGTFFIFFFFLVAKLTTLNTQKSTKNLSLLFLVITSLKPSKSVGQFQCNYRSGQQVSFGNVSLTNSDNKDEITLMIHLIQYTQDLIVLIIRNFIHVKYIWQK